MNTKETTLRRYYLPLANCIRAQVQFKLSKCIDDRGQIFNNQ